jgi:hypothetical protein
MTRDQATTAMVLAERVSQGVRDRNHKDGPFIERWAEELGLSGTTTVDMISGGEHDRALTSQAIPLPWYGT